MFAVNPSTGVIMTQEGIARSLQNNLFIFHKNVGVALIALIVLRALYRWRNPPPPEPSHLADWQIKAADATHASFELDLPAGPADLLGTLVNQEGEEFGAYFASVEWLGLIR